MGTHAPSGRLLRCRWRADAWDLPQSLAGWIGGGDLFDFCVHRSNLLFEIFPLAPEQADKVTHPWCEVRVGVLQDLRHRVLQPGWSLREGHAALEQEGPQLVDDRGSTGD